MGTLTLVGIIAAVVIGLIYASITAVTKRIMPRLFTTAQLVGRRLPQPVRRSLRRGADSIYPRWRIIAGEAVPRAPLHQRVTALRQQKRHDYFIVGAIYIDLTITPVMETKLNPSEHSDLDQVSIGCGGSAWFVGRYLERKFGKKSTLYTKIGSVDPLGKHLKTQMKREHWHKSLRFTVEPTKQCGVSVHLVNRNKGYHTTFTHKGALADLDWGPVHDDLRWRSRKGGIMHISGYFRTSLCNDLSVSLRQLSPDLIVCVDHGRFRPQDHERAARALLESFDEKLIDIYICTIPELRQLMELDGLMSDPSDPDEDLLRRYNRSGRLPEVTVVRCEPGRSEAKAYVVTEKAVSLVKCRASIPRRLDYPGRNNAFNAALMYYIVEGATDEEFGAAICNATQKSLERWADPT